MTLHLDCKIPCDPFKTYVLYLDATVASGYYCVVTVSDNQTISVCYEFQIAVTSKKMVSCLSTV